LLQSKRTLKAGRSIHLDKKWLLEDWGVDVPNSTLVRLESHCKQRGLVSKATYSLRRLSQIILKHDIPKPNSVRYLTLCNLIFERGIVNHPVGYQIGEVGCQRPTRNMLLGTLGLLC
jgi:hypothetical protein